MEAIRAINKTREEKLYLRVGELEDFITMKEREYLIERKKWKEEMRKAIDVIFVAYIEHFEGNTLREFKEALYKKFNLQEERNEANKKEK